MESNTNKQTNLNDQLSNLNDNVIAKFNFINFDAIREALQNYYIDAYHEGQLNAYNTALNTIISFVNNNDMPESTKQNLLDYFKEYGKPLDVFKDFTKPEHTKTTP